MRNKYYKDLYTSQYEEASKKAKNNGHTKSIDDLINSHELVKILKGDINTCNKCIEAIKNSPVTPITQDSDRLIAGFEAYKAQCEHNLYKLISQIEAGQNLSDNEANNKASDERRIIRATKKDIKESRKNYKSKIREIGRTKDICDNRISRVLGEEAYRAKSLCQKFRFKDTIDYKDVRFMLAEQTKLSNKNKAPSMDL